MKYLPTLAVLAALTPGLALADNIASALTGQDATYTLTLAKVRTHDVTGATGAMRFSVIDGCTGWGTTQHMTLLIRNADGSLNKSVSDYMTWETKDGKTLTFTLRERDNDGKLTTDDAGTATHTGPDNAGQVVYTTPAGRLMKLPPGTLFPMAHTETLLKGGTDGAKTIAVPLFDGTSDSGAQNTFIAILGHNGPLKNKYPALAKLPSSDVDIAFYDSKHADQNPNFRSQMRYYDDGVADNIMLDFGDFVMRGTLDKLSIPASTCK
ncbi:MAG: hypothetical protein B7Z75_07560 [Acidocella sp. 20-57-95]|nr:MAG: hypothetical protein B7Z75_07560 [Acidocella sp. 20-57-95]OYV58814.1 MAG: hypothetical protein B7Z71_09360 [Acidocella sp. 21-58-7]HQT62932.1 DUF1849 family protein [Acidocella sp.]HQU04429.1 DUF1849 family protein [Acidocella sp.]